MRSASACVLAGALALPLIVQAQSAADLSHRIRIDGDAADFTPAEAAFRTAAICVALGDSCTADEEPRADGACTALQDLRQVRVTWDATQLYVAVEARAANAACVVYLDVRPGGLASASALGAWRRAIRFGGDFRPDAFLAVRDAAHAPELWLVDGDEGLVRVPADSIEARSNLDADADGRGLEAAIPWRVLFPEARFEVNSARGAPAAPMLVLPAASGVQGLRLAAAVVASEAGAGACDVAPDAVSGSPPDAGLTTDMDRWVRVDWDAGRDGFVDFAAAVQTQTAPRFEPTPVAAPEGVRLTAMRTFARGQPSGLVLVEAGLAFTFAFDIASPVPSEIYVHAAVYSLQGERVRTLYQDARRTPVTPAAPFGAFGDPSADRWDGRDDRGTAVAGGIYVLRVNAGPTPGRITSHVQRPVTVVR